MVEHIGGYEITGKLGAGGFGTVYRGYDPKIDRVVAIKVLSNQEDASLISRFRYEAMTAGNLHHKNIVTIYDFEERAEPPFLVMEYLDGVDLKQIITNKAEREALSLLEKLEIMAEAAQGLQCAHENGVVHRDVKPANIMRLKGGSVKIMDFGIARLTNSAATRLTRTGLMIGTVEYMAPELFGSAEAEAQSEADALCDIWSYGVVFYELMTGIQPFHAGSPVAVMGRIWGPEPSPVASLVPECPPELNAHLRRLLSKDRHKRIQSLDDFLLDLEPIIKRLAQIEVPELVSRAERLIAADDTEQAQAVIGRIFKLDRQNQTARLLRERLRERVKLRAIRPRIEALLREAEAQVSGGNFEGALEKLKSAELLDPGSPTLRSRLERNRGEEQRARQAEEMISRGRRALNEGNLTGAFAHLSQALETSPSHSQAPALLDEVKRAMHDRDIQMQIRATMGQANDFILIEAYDDAITLLADLKERTSSNEQVVRRLLEARQLKRAQEIKEQLNADINAARELFKRGSYQDACQALEELDRENPGNPAIEVLLAHARERLRTEQIAGQVDKFLAQARGHRASGRFEEALRCISSALDLDRASSKALALQKTYLDEAQANRDRKKIDAELIRCRDLLDHGKLEEALAGVDRLAADHPGESRVAQAKREISGKIAEKDEFHRKEIQRGVQEAERLLAEGRAESATSLLGNLTVQFPAEAAVHDLFDRARQLRLSQETQELLDARLKSAKSLLDGGNLKAACVALEELDRQNPNNPAVDVLLNHTRERLKAKEVSDRIEELHSKAAAERAKGRFDQAIGFVQRALEIDSANAQMLALQKTLQAEQQSGLDRRHVAAELEKCKGLMKENKLDQALAAVRQLESKYPSQALVAETMREIAARIKDRDELRAQKLTKGVGEAESFLADGNAGGAIKVLEKLVVEFPEAAELRRLVERTHQLERNQQRDEIRTNILTARRFSGQREWDKALAVIDQGRKKQPDCRDYLDEAENIGRLRDCDRELSAVEEALKSAPPEQAISLAEASLARFPGHPRAVALLQSARNLRDLRDLTAYIRRRVANGDLDEARQLLTDGKVRFPDSTTLRESENEIERVQRLDQSVHNARIALQRRAFAEARNIVNALLAVQPGNGAARQLLADVDAQQKEHERQQAYDSGRKEVDRFIRLRKFTSAIERAEQLVAAFPDDHTLQEDLDRAHAARDEHTRRENYTRIRTEALSLSDEGHLDEAIAAIGSLLQGFPGDSTLTADLESMRAAKLLREERVRIDAQISELDSLFRNGDAEAVRRGAREILKEHKEPRAMALLEWAERSITQAREIRRIGRDTKLLWVRGGIGGFGTVAIAVLISWLWPGDIEVQPREIVFSYEQGAAAPISEGFRIDTRSPIQSWTITSADPWLSISKSQGSGSSHLDVRVDPSKLSAGQKEYKSTATVTSGSRTQTMGVSLIVKEPKPQDKLGVLMTRTDLASSLNPSGYGQNVTFKVTLTPSDATGTVTVNDGSTRIGSATLSGGKANFTTTLSAGKHLLTALYSGDANHPRSSSAALTQLVKQVSTSATLTSQPNPSYYGQSVTLIATVSETAPTGTVTFRDGSAIIGTGTLSGGKATRTLTTLSVGSHNLAADYGGAGNYSATSALSQHTVVEAVDCHNARTYKGLGKDTIVWTGDSPLAPDGVLTIHYGSNVNSSTPFGHLKGQHFPGCPVDVPPIKGLTLDQIGSTDIRVVNGSGQPLSTIQITWVVKP